MSIYERRVSGGGSTPSAKRVRVYHAGNQVITTSSVTTVTLTNGDGNDDTTYFTGNLHASGTNPDTVTLIRTGVYLFTFSALASGMTSGTSAAFFLQIGGVTERQLGSLTFSDNTRGSWACTYRTTAANALASIGVFATTAANACNIGGANFSDTGLEITYLGS